MVGVIQPIIMADNGSDDLVVEAANSNVNENSNKAKRGRSKCRTGRSNSKKGRSKGKGILGKGILDDLLFFVVLPAALAAFVLFVFRDCLLKC
jgi:hypothetical protein